MEDIEESKFEILNALKSGDERILEKYYLTNHKLVNDILSKISDVNPSLIEYLLSKNDTMMEDLGRSSADVLLYIFEEDRNLYHKLFAISSFADYNPEEMIRDIDAYLTDINKSQSYPDQYNISRERLLETIDFNENRMNLKDLINLYDENVANFRYNPRYRLEGYNVLAYILFRIIKDNDELRSILDIDLNSIDKLVEIAFVGGAPDIVLQLLSKYSPGLYESIINSDLDKTSPQCNLFNEDV